MKWTTAIFAALIIILFVKDFIEIKKRTKDKFIRRRFLRLLIYISVLLIVIVLEKLLY